MDTPDGDGVDGSAADASDAPDADAFHRSVPAGGGPRRVLFVDDEPGAADLAAVHVDRLVDGVETVTYTDPEDALAAIETDRVDCVVSDFDMPGSNGLELLTDARAVDPGLPFVLFTGKGSEEIASEAVSAGVTDYLQKGVGRDRYEMLANSVENALERRRVERDLREVNAKVTALHEFATEVAACERVADVFERTVAAAEDILHFDRCVTARREGEALVPAALSESVTADEVRTFEVGEGVVGTTAATERTMVVDNLSVDPDDPNQLESPADPDRSEPDRAGVTGDGERADGSTVADPVADDIRSAISVPIGSHGVLQAVSDGYAAFDEGDVEFTELLAAHAADAVEQIQTENALRAERDRLTALFDDLLALARQGRTVNELEPVDLAETAERAWRTVDTGDASLDAPDGSVTVDADPERLRTLLEDLFTNSVEHGSTGNRTESGDSVVHGATGSRTAADDDVERGSTAGTGITVTVGALPNGFYVADDGAGFAAGLDPDEAAEYGVSSDPHGTGFGLAIVREIAAAHGWALAVDDADGARFEFRDEG